MSASSPADGRPSVAPGPKSRPAGPAESAQALQAVATLTWALPLVFCGTYAVAWFFSIKNLLLITGHFFALGSASLMAEAASRLGDRPKLRGLARTTQALAIACVICLLYAFYPMIRMLLEADEPFIAAIESEDPAMRLALASTVAYALGAMATTAFVALISRAATEFEQKLGGMQIAIVAAFLSAALAGALHAAFAAKTELRDIRHALAFGLVAVAVLAYSRLYPAIQRVAQCLHREASTQA